MRLIRDVPSTVLRMAVFKLLKEGQTIPIHGSVPKGAKLPYITLGAATLNGKGPISEIAADDVTGG